MSPILYNISINVLDCRIEERLSIPSIENMRRCRLSDWPDEDLARIRAVLKKITSLRIDNPADAEDIVQETLLTMAAKCPDVDLEYGLLVWALGILRKKVGNYYKRKDRFISIDDPQHAPACGMLRSPACLSPESRLLHAELHRHIEGILEHFPPNEAEALLLMLDGHLTGEIVDLLSPEKYQNVVNRLYRGRMKLARGLSRRGYGPSAVRAASGSR